MANKQPSAGPLEEFTQRPVFQLTLAAVDLAATRVFYVETLGSTIERESADAIDFNFFGGTLIAQRVPVSPATAQVVLGADGLPLPNFGLSMSWEDWHRAVDHLNYVGVTYRLAPTMQTTADGRDGALFAIDDPSGNCLAFHAYKTPRAS
ncbi:MAG: hypothetical protein HYX63_11025 [Gammaproteobacteria bacterium]|nr:hypothetical protein [Gammaproteobacteria bacterium]